MSEKAPCRITSLFGLDKPGVEKLARSLVREFGWREHTWATLETNINGQKTVIYSVILWNDWPKEGPGK